MKPAARILVPLVGLATLWPAISPAVALLAGIALALTLGNPYPTKPLQQKLLSGSVVGLGAGMNLVVVAGVGLRGIGYTAVGIGVALLVGTLLGRFLRVNRDTGLLITVGTAICGGSAIAAVAPVLRAKDEDVSMALVTVFLLNAIALFVFPAIGHRVGLGEEAFGLWSALAVHDTSSVVGTASQYGPRALEVATSAKLARALWIVPLTFAIAAVRARSGGGEKTDAKPKRPWFIAGFLLVAAIVTFVPGLRPVGEVVAFVARRTLTATLFLIGLGLSRSALRTVGVRPMVLGVALWLFLGGATLLAIERGWIGS